MIVSASYRTDIPAFYARWFENRFEAGFAKVVNPYGGPESVVPLRQGVEGFVFWTRNVAPFVAALRLVRRAELPFVVSHTITGYDRALEISVIDPDKAVAGLRAVADEFGPRSVVWRYDPIVFSSLTPARFHLENFTRLAQALRGAVDECVISFATLYKKTARNLDRAARAEGFDWHDPDWPEKRDLARRLTLIAGQNGMRLTACSQQVDTDLAACIDARRLEDVAAQWGRPRLIPLRIRGNRPDCLCQESRDIGAYDTCPHGCAYCYAVTNRGLAKRRFAGHDPDSEYLFPPTPRDDTETLLV